MQRFKAKLLIFIGTVIWSLVMIKSGLVYRFGMGFWGPNGHDGVWHLSLSSGLARGSLEMPIFAGSQIKNYHIGFDLLLALLHFLTQLPIVNVYFQILPPILAVLTGVSVYVFVKYWQKSEAAALWSVLFTYFATSFGWLVSSIRYHSIGGESMFWAQQAISTLINPPFALSLIFIFFGLTALLKDKKLLAIICFGFLTEIKIYAAILVFGGLLIASFKNKDYFKVFLGSLTLGLLVFLPLNRSSGSLLVFKPFWFLETMMAVSDRANWPKYYEAMINYRAAHNYFKGIPAYLIAFAIFAIGNMGLRVLALGQLVKHKFDTFDFLFWSMISAGFILPMFILQTGTPWNTIQFTYYSLVFSGILAGVYISKFKSQIPILFAFILLTAPGVWGTLRQYLPGRPPAMVSTKELEALNFLRLQPAGTVLTPLYDPGAAHAAENNPPRPLYLYESTAYVSAFSNHAVFLEDEVNLNITNYSWQSRAQQTRDFFTTLDSAKARRFLQDNHIKYIYLPQIYKIRPQIGPALIGAKTIFDNYEASIWLIN